MLKQRFEDPIDSAEQMIENNITLVLEPKSENYWKPFFANSPITEYRTLSKKLIFSHKRKTQKDENFYPNLVQYDVIGNGTHALMLAGLNDWQKPLDRWWRGKLVMGNYPYSGYLSDKKWHLNEAFDIFSFIFC